MIPAPVLVLILSRILVLESAASSLPGPGRVELQGGLLRWTPAADHLNHTVQVQRFGLRSQTLDKEWISPSQCQETETSVCDVSALLQEAEADHTCLRFRVRAQSGPDQSEAVEACGASEGRCTPQLGLSPSGGSLTVNLSRKHSLVVALGHHTNYNVCHWREDRPEPLCEQTLDSLLLPDLEPGQTYCASAQFVHFGQYAVGAPRCPLCQELPLRPSPHTAAVLGSTLTLVLLALVCGATYVLIFQKKRIKAWFKPEQNPDSLILTSGGALVYTPSEEDYSVITNVIDTQQDCCDVLK